MLMSTPIPSPKDIAKAAEEIAKAEKEFEIGVAKRSVGPVVKNQYQHTKSSSGNLIYSDVNKFNQSIVDTSKLVTLTISGDTHKAIAKTLNSLIKGNSKNLTDGVDSIKGISAINFAVNIFADIEIEKPNKTNGLFKTITLLDDFINTRNTILDSIPFLQNISKTNDNLLNKLEGDFKQGISKVAAMLPRMSYSEVEAIAVSQGLLPTDSIELGAVQQVSSSVTKKISKIEKNADKIAEVYANTKKTDMLIASGFNLVSNTVVGFSKKPVGLLNTVIKGSEKGAKLIGAFSPKKGSFFGSLTKGLKKFSKSSFVKGAGKKLGIAGSLLDGLDTFNQDMDKGKGAGYSTVHATARTGGKVAGTAAGAKVGAVIGAIGGPLGAAAGGFIGGWIGGVVGGKLADKTVDSVYKNSSSRKSKNTNRSMDGLNLA